MNMTIKKCDKLRGTIKISGSKNSALPLFSLALLTKKKLIFTNVPMISDVFDMLKLLKHVGVKIKVDYQNNKVTLKKKKVKNKLDLTIANRIRATYYLYPGLIRNNKKCFVTTPGGCNFTSRPIDYHLNMFKQTGVEISQESNFICFKRKKLKTGVIEFKTPSVGATINTIMHSVLTKGTTLILNQPLEPEIEEVIKCLTMMGANIQTKNNQITIVGKRKLRKVVYNIMPDRIELGSFLLLGSIIPSDITFTNIKEESIAYLDPTLKELGIKYIYNKEKLYLTSTGKINSTNTVVSTYPNFPTDLQPILCSALTKGSNESTVVDKVYPNRLSHVNLMKQMNANIDVLENVIYIRKSSLEGKKVYAPDLRCGFALVMCGCLAKGKTTIENFEVINRGYENVIPKLRSLGVQIEEHWLNKLN